MKKNILIFGAGGHAKSCIDLVTSSTKFNINYIFGLRKELGNKILSFKVNKCIDNIKNVKKKHQYAIIGIGQIKSAKKRIYYFDLIKKEGILLPVIISFRSYVSQYAKIDEGTLIFNGVVIGPETKIGKNCIINNLSLVDHDVNIGNHVHVSTGARINGGATIESGSFIGSGAVIKEGVRIGKNCIIGAGLVIKKNLKDNSYIT